MNYKTTFPLLVLSISIFARTTYAGGGQYTPINFYFGQQVYGKSIDLEIEVHDFSNGQVSNVVGEEFKFVAEDNLKGAKCETRQATSDSRGRIKGRCSAEEYGHFTFHIKPITQKITKNNSTNIDLYFVKTTFPDLSNSVKDYKVVINPSEVNLGLGESFTMEAKLMKNGQAVSDYDFVKTSSWIVLQGSINTKSSPDKNNCTAAGCLNRRLIFETSQYGETIIQVTALLKDGGKIISPNVSVNVTPKQVPQPTVKPEISVESKPLEIEKPKPQTLETSPSITKTEAELQAELQKVKAELEEQKKELKSVKAFVQELLESFKKWMGVGN